MNLTHKDVQNILKIIDDAEHLEEVEFVYGGFRLHVRRHGSKAGTPAAAAAGSSAPALRPAATASSAEGPRSINEIVPDGMVAVRAPMLGTFYRAPAPGAKPFVEIGQRIKAHDTVCIIEVMKLFSSIAAGVDGTISQILAENATLVEYNQILIVIEPEQE